MSGTGSVGSSQIRMGLSDSALLQPIRQLSHQFYASSTPDPLCYKGRSDSGNYLVITASQDRLEPGNVTVQAENTTKGVFDLVAQNKDAIPKDITNVLIPVALTSRRHWVTVNYDIKTNTATIIDPRPWYVSFLWPNSNLKKEIQDGLVKIGLADKDKPIKFSTIYQGVQHNDVTCGSWSLANISAQLSGKKLHEMGSVFSANDEPQVVRTFSPGVEEDKVYKPTLFTRIFQGVLNLFGLSKPAQPDLINSFTTTAKAPDVAHTRSSYATMFTSDLRAENGIGPNPIPSVDNEYDENEAFEILADQSPSTAPPNPNKALSESAASLKGDEAEEEHLELH